MTSSAEPIYLKDYQAPFYTVEKASFIFKIFNDHTQVDSVLSIRRGPKYVENAPLKLDGEYLKLLKIAVNGHRLSEKDYTVDTNSLTIHSIADACDLEISVEIKPTENTALTGLYASNKLYCTQCESHGFRRITYFIDRPDNLSFYNVRIEADEKQFPHLLSNGNPIAHGQLSEGRHFVEWQDPFKKPCYLFALVAGDFHVEKDIFVTQSGRNIDLRIYVEKHVDKSSTNFAMYSLKEAMRWDEKVYGREYDLDIYMIVAVSDFNMGAMENKGLNIFNEKYILANPSVATDADYQHVLQVVAHEYFHNWSGNRVTLRDWFQLSLKEGFTVFRDQSFATDHGSSGVCRIEEMTYMQTMQFAEDASPMSHPVRPESYIEMNNFYTVTVYEKGAENIRMLHTLLGPEQFRKACDEYFDTFDGKAVTVDDFIRTMQSHTDIHLEQFKLWYSQSGTPEVTIRSEHDIEHKTLLLHFSQQTLPTADQKEKLPLLIPIRIALLSESGALLPFALPGTDNALEHVYTFTEKEAILRIEHISEKVVPSLLRDFSAPVKVNTDETPDELFFIAANDNDPCSRAQAFNKLCLHECFEMLNMGSMLEPKRLALLMASVLQHETQDYMVMAHLLALPAHSFFAQAKLLVNVDVIVSWRKETKQYLAKHLYDTFKQYYLALEDSSPFSAQSAGKRALRQVCLDYLVASGNPESVVFAAKQYNAQTNMTETISALRALRDSKNEIREFCLQDFYQRWKENALVLDKWFTMQATADRDDTVYIVRELMQHPAFQIKNPNRVYSLLGAFGHNFPQFHQINGEGYALIRDAVIELNKINPQVAARVIKPLIDFRRFDSERAALMQSALNTIAKIPNLSKDVFEIVSKAFNENVEK